MSLPDTIATGTVVGHFIDGAGAPMQGTVGFRPDAVVTAPGQAFVMPEYAEFTLIDGAFTAVLAASDAPGLNPSGFTYKAYLRIGQTKLTFSFLLPAGETVDLATVAPVQPTRGTSDNLSLRSPNGTLYYIRVTDAGSLVVSTA